MFHVMELCCTYQGEEADADAYPEGQMATFQHC